ncbi:MAG: PAS domain S-box protein, partial [Sediminibacterium sp.]|nr:PAS domain S-box protein [Sediminibacterium sp.]
TIKSGKTWNGEFLNKKKDGSLFWEDVTISPVRDNSGEIKHFLAIKNDITKDKEIEARFNKIAVDQSHQVRGPLTNILGITKLLNFDITNEEKSYLTSQLEIAAKELDKAIHRVVGESRNQQIN